MASTAATIWTIRQLSPNTRIQAAFHKAFSGVCGKKKSMYGGLPSLMSCAASM